LQLSTVGIKEMLRLQLKSLLQCGLWQLILCSILPQQLFSTKLEVEGACLGFNYVTMKCNVMKKK